jgi:hypothetical protein
LLDTEGRPELAVPRGIVMLLLDVEDVRFADCVAEAETLPVPSGTENDVVTLALLIGAPDDAAGGAPPAQ